MKNLQGLEQFKTELSDHLSQSDLIELAYQMGYTNFDQFQFRLNKLINEPYLGLGDGYYDFKMDTVTFIQTLCEQLDLEVEKAQKLILCIQENLTAYNEFRPYISIETDFDIHQNSSALLALTFMEPKRQIKVTLDEFCLDCNAMIEVISQKVVAHYQQENGVVDQWGDIQSYVYFHNLQTQVHFDCQGEVITSPELIQASRMSLQV